MQNTSDIKPDTIHADTQGQSFPVFTLAHLFGFDLIPRILNWKDLLFFRPSAQTCYTNIDALFDDPGRNVIDWDLIRDHWVDLMKIGISIQQGTLSSGPRQSREVGADLGQPAVWTDSSDAWVLGRAGWRPYVDHNLESEQRVTSMDATKLR